MNLLIVSSVVKKRGEGSLAVVWSAAARRRFHKGGLPPFPESTKRFTAQGPAPAVKSGGQPPHSIRAESPALVATASSRCNEARRQGCRRHLRAENPAFISVWQRPMKQVKRE